MTRHKKFKISGAVPHVIFIILSLMCIVPLLLVLSISFTNEHVLVTEGYHALPKEFTLDAYRYVLTGASSVIQAYGVTIFYTAVTTILHLLVTIMLAFPLTRPEVSFKRGLMFFIFFPMLFSGGLVPTYILIVRVLHIKNTIWVYILPGLVSTMNVIIMRNFVKALPEGLVEAARIDGANPFRVLFQIIMPLSKPSLATIGLFTAVSNWNNWMTSSLYIDDPKLYSLQYLLQSLMNNIKYLQANMSNVKGLEQAAANLPSEGARMATCILSIGPIILLYPLIQKYFEKGLTIGAVKE